MEQDKTEERDAIAIVENVPREVLADAIVSLSRASRALLTSGLTRRALEVLLKDATAVPMSTIGRVLNGLAHLEELYVVPKKPALNPVGGRDRSSRGK